MQKDKIVLVLILFFSVLFPSLTAAKILQDYYQISYEPITLSKTEISGNESFYLIIQGKATAVKNFFLPIKEVRINTRFVANQKTASGQEILNSGYPIFISSFPGKKGQSHELKKQIPLAFPAKSRSGDYVIIGEIVKVEVKLPLIGWQNLTYFLSQLRLSKNIEIGSVKYISQ